MDDLISRTAALDAVELGITYAKVINIETGEATELFKASNTELRKAIDRIKALPTVQPDLSSYSDKLWRAAYERGKAEAQPQRMRGRWMEHYSHEDGERDGVECSECRTHFYFGGQLMNFCPNCGADMRKGEQDG